jgi:3-dehydroquinate dehydratase/shikimate dehydrogenase
MAVTPARVCAVVTEETIAAARKALHEAKALAELAELRLDCLRDFDFANPANLSSLLEDKPLPVIITCRATGEGGRQYVDEQARLRLLVEGARRLADYCDVEAASYARAAALSPDLSRLIVSHHNFDGTPADLERTYEDVTALPAGIHKIVTQANDVSDSLAIFRLLDRAKRENRQLIALAMGTPGLVTRVLGPSHGSFLTYGAIRRGAESASGQPTCEELKNLYRISRITGETRIVGIIGNPILHSASPAMHNSAIGHLGLDCVYLPFEVDNLEAFFKRFVRPRTREIEWRLRGLSVTIPHKTEAMSFLDEIDPSARAVGAVNTIVIDGDKLTGHNTDVAGAIEPLEALCSLRDEHCAIIGAGGAARAVVYGLLQRGARVTVFARDVARARAFGEHFGVEVLPISELARSIAPIVINSTPVGMSGHSKGESPVPREALAGRRMVYDLVYNPAETRFLAEARATGCRTLGGLEMLVAQAALQFKLWNGSQAPVDTMRSSADKWLSGSG